jgi:hypothetical protein
LAGPRPEHDQGKASRRPEMYIAGGFILLVIIVIVIVLLLR